MIKYICEVIDTQAGASVDDRVVVVESTCLTFECAKSFIESSLLRLVPSFIAIRAEWSFWEGKALINAEDVGCPVYGKISYKEEL